MPSVDQGSRLPAADADALAFFRARVTGVAQWTGIFMIGFVVTTPLLDAHRPGLSAFTRGPRGGDPSLAIGVVLLTAASIAGRLRLGRRALDVLDAAFTLIACVGFAATPFLGTPSDHIELLLALVSTYVLVMRAAIVPSTGRRTALVGSLAVTPLVASTYLAGRGGSAEGVQDLAWHATVGAAQWAVTAVLASSLLSRRLYAMQRRINAAERFGQYTLEEKIGEGGMGEVFRARHALLRRPTALKLLPRSRAGAQAIERFEREVQMTSRLTHPNTIQIYDFGRAEDGTFYYAMELIDGVTLGELVTEEGAQPPGRVVRILTDVCASLAEAHAAGLVHRDIKPQNVMLCVRGGTCDVVKVLDFGLVKAADDAPGDAGRSRVLVGTPEYMAPEAFEHPSQLGPASDLYAVGALGYFLLTGAPVFTGQGAFELFGQHLHARPISPSDRAGRAIPEALERLVLACLAKSPEDRPASAAALRALLLQTGLAGAWSDSEAAEWWRARDSARPVDATSHPVGAHAPAVRSLQITRE